MESSFFVVDALRRLVGAKSALRQSLLTLKWIRNLYPAAALHRKPYKGLALCVRAGFGILFVLENQSIALVKKIK